MDTATAFTFSARYDIMSTEGDDGNAEADRKDRKTK